MTTFMLQHDRGTEVFKWSEYFHRLNNETQQIRYSPNKKNEDLKIKSNSYSAKALGPTDCLDLWRGEQNVPGYYPVVNNDKLRFVYCNRDGILFLMIGLY